jgi:hypothetical protein
VPPELAQRLSDDVGRLHAGRQVGEFLFLTRRHVLRNAGHGESVDCAAHALLLARFSASRSRQLGRASKGSFGYVST